MLCTERTRIKLNLELDFTACFSPVTVSKRFLTTDEIDNTY